MTPLIRGAGALARDERGNGLIELGMIAPVLGLLVVGIVDLTQGISRRAELHSAVHHTLEKTAARRFQLTMKADGTVDAAAMKADTATAAGVDPSAVTVTAWLECDGVEQPNFNGTCPPLATPDPECSANPRPASANCEAILARYIRVRVDATYKPTFGKVVSTAADGTVPLFAEAAVRVQ